MPPEGERLTWGDDAERSISVPQKQETNKKRVERLWGLWLGSYFSDADFGPDPSKRQDFTKPPNLVWLPKKCNAEGCPRHNKRWRLPKPGPIDDAWYRADYVSLTLPAGYFYCQTHAPLLPKRCSRCRKQITNFAASSLTVDGTRFYCNLRCKHAAAASFVDRAYIHARMHQK